MIKNTVIILFSFWGFLAVFAEFVANDDPILYQNKNGMVCPACLEWGNQYEYKETNDGKTLIPAPITYDANTLEPSGHILQAPLTEGTKGIHWLGTDSQSRDIFAGIIYGSRYALLIAFFSTLFAAIVGVFLGVLAGYYGNRRFRLPVWVIILVALLLIYLIFLGAQGLIQPLITLLLIIAVLVLPFLLKNLNDSGKMVPLDSMVTKGIEVIDSLPALFVLLAWAATIQGWSILSLSILIAFFSWPTFARLSRIEVNKWLSGDWIKTLEKLKMPDSWIISRQLADLIIIPLSVHAAFVAAAAVSIEATLSFLGFGLGAEVVSWGGLLNEARQYFHAWWLIIFPGLSLFSLLWGFNQLAKMAQNYVRRSKLKASDQLL